MMLFSSGRAKHGTDKFRCNEAADEAIGLWHEYICTPCSVYLRGVYLSDTPAVPRSLMQAQSFPSRISTGRIIELSRELLNYGYLARCQWHPTCFWTSVNVARIQNPLKHRSGKLANSH